MKGSINYHQELLRRLKNADFASEYLTSAFDDGDKELFLLALRNVVKAHGGVSKLSRLSKLNREHLYRILSKRGNPEIYTLGSILHALGLRLAVITEDDSKLSKAA